MTALEAVLASLASGTSIEAVVSKGGRRHAALVIGRRNDSRLIVRYRWKGGWATRAHTLPADRVLEVVAK